MEGRNRTRIPSEQQSDTEGGECTFPKLTTLVRARVRLNARSRLRTLHWQPLHQVGLNHAGDRWWHELERHLQPAYLGNGHIAQGMRGFAEFGLKVGLGQWRTSTSASRRTSRSRPAPSAECPVVSLASGATCAHHHSTIVCGLTAREHRVTARSVSHRPAQTDSIPDSEMAPVN